MKDYTYSSFRIKNQEFSVTQYNDGRIYVHSIFCSYLAHLLPELFRLTKMLLCSMNLQR